MRVEGVEVLENALVVVTRARSESEGPRHDKLELARAHHEQLASKLRHL